MDENSEWIMLFGLLPRTQAQGMDLVRERVDEDLVEPEPGPFLREFIESSRASNNQARAQFNADSRNTHFSQFIFWDRFC